MGDDISRTPIAVSRSNTPENDSINSTPQGDKVIRVLQLDPRSPTIECTRTPLMVESHEPRKRLGALKPSKLAQLSEPSTPSSDKDDSIKSDDPRSPTIKVPRTPLQDKLQEFD